MSKPELKTQGRKLIEHLKRRPMTYGEMQMLGISTSPQKRVAESLYPNEQLVKTYGHDNLIRWRVKTFARWTSPRLTAGER
jgi:hypothetical protein